MQENTEKENKSVTKAVYVCTSQTYINTNNNSEGPYGFFFNLLFLVSHSHSPQLKPQRWLGSLYYQQNLLNKQLTKNSLEGGKLWI